MMMLAQPAKNANKPSGAAVNTVTAAKIAQPAMRLTQGTRLGRHQQRQKSKTIRSYRNTPA
jgi:hypothetical protein